MATDGVLVERRDATTIVSLNRPGKRNAVDRATAERLAEADRELALNQPCASSGRSRSGVH